MNIKIKTFAVSVATAVSLLSFAQLAHADSFSVNFENPPYTLGVINAQDGWSSLGAAGSGCAVYDHAVSSSLGTVGFGLQSLRISNAVVSGCFGDQTFSKSLADEAGETTALNGGMSGGTRQKHFEAQFSLASAVPGSQQTGLYMSVSPDRGDGARMSYLRFEDQADGVHVFFDDVTDPTHAINGETFNETDIATLTRAPHTIKFSMDFVDGPDNDVVKIYIDGVLIHTGTSWEDYFRYDTESNPSLVDVSRTVDSLLFRTGGSTNNPSVLGQGFLVDNLSLLSGPILVGPPTSKDQCKKDGWKIFNNPSFKNQGQCVSFVEKAKEHGDNNDQNGNNDHQDDHGNDHQDNGHSNSRD